MGCRWGMWRVEGCLILWMGPSPLLTPPPPLLPSFSHTQLPPSPSIQACRVLLWSGDGNPGTWQRAGDLPAPHSRCPASPAFSPSWPSLFIFYSCSPLRSLAFSQTPPTPQSLHTSLPLLPTLLCPAAYFSAHPLYFKASFSLRSITWKETPPFSPFLFQARETAKLEARGKRSQKRGTGEKKSWNLVME